MKVPHSNAKVEVMSMVVIIDDDKGVCAVLEQLIQQHGHSAVSAQTIADGLALVENRPADLVLLDVNLPDGSGLKQLHRISQSPAKPEVIIMTGQGDPDGAEFAIHNGAWDYIEKSASPKAMTLRLLRALEYRAGKQPAAAPAIDRRAIVGESRPLTHALDQLAHTMYSDAGVLITGDTGTGKELFARAVHRNSPRKEASFVVVDCAALPHHLVESMLFGHVKGAFTGADAPREGLVAQADGGTLFLDEIGEMPLSLQKAFLRVLESRCFRPIGGKEERRSDFRIVASTNRDLDQMVRKGRFRQDLLYRLRTFHLHLPALRHRRQDIPLLAEYHLQRLSRLYGGTPKEMSADFLEVLAGHDWPGNVRELVNTIDSALSAARDATVLYSCHLPADLRAKVACSQITKPCARPAEATPFDAARPLPPLQAFREKMIEKAETQYLNTLLSNAGGNMSNACTTAGISRSRLYELMKKHAIAAR